MRSINTGYFNLFPVIGVLGAFLFFMGFALLLPVFIDLIYQEHTWHSFLTSALIAFSVGGALCFLLCKINTKCPLYNLQKATTMR